MFNWKFFLPASVIVIVIALATVIKVPDSTSTPSLMSPTATSALLSTPKPSPTPIPLPLPTTPTTIIDSSVQASLGRALDDPSMTSPSDVPDTTAAQDIQTFDQAATISANEI